MRGEWRWFDVGYGPEKARVKGTVQGNVLIEVPMDGQRIIDSEHLHETKEAAEDAPEASFQ